MGLFGTYLTHIWEGWMMIWNWYGVIFCQILTKYDKRQESVLRFAVQTFLLVLLMKLTSSHVFLINPLLPILLICFGSNISDMVQLYSTC